MKRYTHLGNPWCSIHKIQMLHQYIHAASVIKKCMKMTKQYYVNLVVTFGFIEFVQDSKKLPFIFDSRNICRMGMAIECGITIYHALGYIA